MEKPAKLNFTIAPQWHKCWAADDACPDLPCEGCEEMGPEDDRCPRHGLNHTGLWKEIDHLRAALAAPPVVDEAKLAEVLLSAMRDEAMTFENGSEEWIAESDPVECLPGLARTLVERRSEWLRGEQV